MANFLSKLFGTKSDRDLKELRPILDEIKAAYEEVKNLDNDGLRAKTAVFREQIQEVTKEERRQIQEMNARLEAEYDMPVDEKQKLYERLGEALGAVYSADLLDALFSRFCVGK